jgi:peptidoglycan/LPS O-acetylase OafA/YrhL
MEKKLQSKENKIYLPGLNGLRAIAAFGVLFSHVNLGIEAYGLPIRKTSDLAGFGVTIFFALSGFLITYLLLKEKEQFNTINIKNFYVRRILRIWPLYFLFIGIGFLVDPVS